MTLIGNSSIVLFVVDFGQVFISLYVFQIYFI